MVLSTREKYIAIGVGVVLGGLLLNSVLISPLLARNDELKASILKEKADYDRDMLTVRAKARNEETWQKQLAAMRRDKSSADSQMNGTLLAWAEASGLNQPGLKPNGTEQPVIKPGGKPTDKEKSFLKLTARFTGSGGMEQVGRFLWQVQTSAIPVRITDMTISTRKEDTDDLELAIGIATLYLSPDGAKQFPDRTAAAGPGTSQQSGRTDNFGNFQRNNPRNNDNNMGTNRAAERGQVSGAGSTTAPATNASEARQ
jgi:hypothetical protein